MAKKLTDLTNKELWQLFPIVISDYNSNWKEQYSSEEQILMQLVGGDNVARISHIGSTSVVGLQAKPTIDILLEVREDIDEDALISTFENNGYIYLSKKGVGYFYLMFLKGYTTKGFEKEVYHIHVRYLGDWDELYFRDYLRLYPDVASDYGKLKLHLQVRYKHDRDGYTEAKTEFIKKITTLARDKFPNGYNIREM